jgi:hypothetical protein
MPPPIPERLSHLHTWKGMAVPRVNAWGGEIEDAEVRYDPAIGKDGVFAIGTEGEGRPFLAKQCPQRQRQIMVEGLCQVCGRKLAPGARWLVLSRQSTVTTTDVKDLGEQHLVTEPWLCSPCLPYMLEACPGIRHRIDEGDFLAMRCSEWTLVYHPVEHTDGRIAVQTVSVLPIAGQHYTYEELVARLDANGYTASSAVATNDKENQ